MNSFDYIKKVFVKGSYNMEEKTYGLGCRFEKFHLVRYFENNMNRTNFI